MDNSGPPIPLLWHPVAPLLSRDECSGARLQQSRARSVATLECPVRRVRQAGDRPPGEAELTIGLATHRHQHIHI